MSRFRCAPDAAARDEPLTATASTVCRWIAVEQSGPWGTNAPTDSRLPGRTGPQLERLGRRLGARVVLVRRHGGGSSAGSGRRVLVADAGADPPWLEELVVPEPTALLERDLSGLTRGESVGGRRVTEPRFLVCTHGSHDVCCAEYGRPAAGAVDAAAGDRGWESSHVGGDRFAANLVVLPDGVYYGRLSPAAAQDVVRAHDDGRVLLSHYRGRVVFSFPVQAAETWLREELDEQRLAAVRLADSRRTGNVRTAVFDVTGRGRFAVSVATRRARLARRLTCHAERAVHPPVHTRLEIVERRR